MKKNNYLAKNISTTSSFSESIFESDRQSENNSSAILSSKYYTQSDTEVEEENRRMRQKKNKNLNNSFNNREVKQNSYSPIKSFRRKRSKFYLYILKYHILI